MKFHFDKLVHEIGIEGVYSAVYDIDIAGVNRDAIEDFVRVIERENVYKANKEYIATDPILSGFRDLHTKVGMSNRKFVSSSESLLKILERHGSLPRINPLVDIYNAVSVATNLALGAHDLNHISGDIRLCLTRGSEYYMALGATSPEQIRAGEYCYVDSSDEVICRMEVRQVEKTKVMEKTNSCFIIVQGNRQTPAEYIIHAHEMLWTAISKFMGGRVVKLYEPIIL